MSVEKRGNKWCFRVREECPITFKIKNKRIGSYNTKKEAKIAEMKYLANVDKVANTSATLDEVFELYKNDKRTKLKESSMYDIEKKYRLHICPNFGSIPIIKITAKSIKSWQLAIYEKGYKNEQLQNLQILFNAILNFALKHDIITINPFIKIGYVVRKEAKMEMKYFTFDEYLIFESYIPDIHIYKEALIVLYYTGMRIGELQALRWYDFRENQLFIHATYDNKLNKVSESTKTLINRYVLLTDNVIKILNDLHAYFSAFADFTNDKFIFGYYDPISHKKISNIKNKAIEQANNSGHTLKQIRLHDLRHSHVSLLKNSGFSSFEIAKRVGNTEREINETYSHLFNEKQEEMKNKLNDYIEKY